MQPFLFPIFGGIAATFAAWRYSAFPVFADGGGILSFGGSLAAIGTTMLGFMLAALAVLASINHTHLVKMMRRTGHYRNLLLTIFTGCLIFLACAVSGYVLLFGMVPTAWFLIGVVGLHATALISLIEIGCKFWLVLTNLTEPTETA